MKWIRKGFFLFLIFFSCSIQTAVAASVQVTLNGNPLLFNTAPYIDHGRVLVPVRGVLESLGYSIQWQEEIQTVFAAKDNMEISLPLNSNTVTVNQEEVTIDVPARLKDDRTFVPLRFLAEYSGADVSWDDSSSTVVIYSIDAEGYHAADSVVYIQTNHTQGSGVVLSSNGLIVTNYHVIENASSIQFIFSDLQTYQGETTVVGLDVQNDIALLKINKNNLTPAFASTTYQIDDAVTAVGAPNGVRNTATTGVIQGFDQDVISTTAFITGGSSGGGLFDASGHLIGITTSYIEKHYLSVPMVLVNQVPQDMSMPLGEIKNYPYTPTAPQNLRCTNKGRYAYVSWTPVYGAEEYYVYTSNSEKGTYTKIKNSALGGDTWYWGFPQAFGISINPKKAYYLKVSAIVDGVETALSAPLKISK